jgi:hypothetical protein
MERIGPCRTCVFFASPSQGDAALGNCIRYAPRPVTKKAGKSGELFFADWPVVESGMGCGEHAYR